MINFSGFPFVTREWKEFKKLLDGTQKTLKVQQEKDAAAYHLFAVDAIVFYYCVIHLDGREPSTLSVADRREQRADRADYETNFMPQANRTIGP